MIRDFSSVFIILFTQLNANLSAELNLSTTNYSLETASANLQEGTAYAELPTMAQSFVVFDGEHIEVCLLVPTSSSYYVGQATKSEDTSISILGKSFQIAKGTMYACSNEVTSW